MGRHSPKRVVRSMVFMIRKLNAGGDRAYEKDLADSDGRNDCKQNG